MPFAPMTAVEAGGGFRPWLSMATIPGIRCFTSAEIHQRLVADQGYFSALQMALVDQLRGFYEGGTTLGGAAEGGTLVFHGGHVILSDTGVIYLAWEQMHLQGLVPSGQRAVGWNLPSSHYPGVAGAQYELRLPYTPNQNWGNLLFGLTPGGDTWFQIEAHSGTQGAGLSGGLRFVSDVLMHAVDFASYKASGYQVGSCGYSPHSETQNPVLY